MNCRIGLFLWCTRLSLLPLFHSSETGIPHRGLPPASFVQRSQGRAAPGLHQQTERSCLKRRARMCRSCFCEQMFACCACLLKSPDSSGPPSWMTLSWHQRKQTDHTVGAIIKAQTVSPFIYRANVGRLVLSSQPQIPGNPSVFQQQVSILNILQFKEFFSEFPCQ